MNTAQDDVMAAITSLSADPSATPPARGGDLGTDDPIAQGSPPPAAPAAAPDAPTPPPLSGRGPDGRFAAAPDPAAPDPAAPAGDPATPPVTPPAENTSPADPAAIRLDPTKPPQGWRPEAREKWNTIPEDIRQEIIRREEASAAGVAKLRQQYEPAENLHKSLTQFEPYFQHVGRPAGEYISDVIQMEQSLSLGNPAQKFETLLAIADTYGVPIRQALDSAMGGKLGTFIQQAHQQHKTPAPIPPEIQRELAESRAFRQQVLDNAATAEYDAFTSDTENHPFFEEVKMDMAALLESGAAETYKDAYEIAVYRNPAVRQRELARQNGIAQKEALRQRQQVAGTIAPPGVTPSIASGNPAEAVSTEDAVRASIARLSAG